MTNEEAIKVLKTAQADFEWEHPYMDSTAFNMAIKALESKDVLDKIRAEIEQLPINTRINWNGCCPDDDYPEIEYVDVSKNHLLEIIDKYMAESEK